jgi:hypothetical protein
MDISAMTSWIPIKLNTHDGGFDFPVQYADGSLGCTTFTDYGVYGWTDKVCVPNPQGGFAPSFGGWGANDGHLVVVDTAHQTYYEFWKLGATNGVPWSTNVGQIISGSLSGNGVPGTTAAQISGLAGDILPGELDCETCLQHALNVVVPISMNSNQVGSQAPAQKTDGGAYGAIFREGAKIRFDPNINVDALQASTATKAILIALQRYGGVITDQTSANGISIYTALPWQPDLAGFDIVGKHLQIFY